MKKFILALCCFTIIPLALSLDGEKATMEGRFVWDTGPGDEGDLLAKFEQTEDHKYTVSFYFQFRGKDYTYTGTAEGDLRNGELKGTVLNENKKRTFTFEGKAIDGKFNGNHAEVSSRGKARPMGTLSLNLQ